MAREPILVSNSLCDGCGFLPADTLVQMGRSLKARCRARQLAELAVSIGIRLRPCGLLQSGWLSGNNPQPESHALRGVWIIYETRP
jgi:hypothetical protein